MREFLESTLSVQLEMPRTHLQFLNMLADQIRHKILAKEKEKEKPSGSLSPVLRYVEPDTNIWRKLYRM